MHCYICDKQLSEAEIQYNRDHDDFDPCGHCLQVIGEVFEAHDEDKITELLEVELIEMGLLPEEEDTEEEESS